MAMIAAVKDEPVILLDELLPEEGLQLWSDENGTILDVKTCFETGSGTCFGDLDKISVIVGGLHGLVSIFKNCSPIKVLK